MSINLSKVLAATDLSVNAAYAIERAAMLSKAAGARLEILHVANLAPLERLRLAVEDSPGAIRYRVLSMAMKVLDDLATSIHHRHGISADTRAIAGLLLAELAKEADALADGLLVCSAGGEGADRHFGPGTTALRLLSTAACPVLVVKQAPIGGYKRVMVPLDLSDGSSRILHHARAVAPEAELTLLHVVEVPFENDLRYASMDDEVIERYVQLARSDALARLQVLAKDAGLPAQDVRVLVMEGDPLASILEVELEYACDLVAMGKDGEGALSEFLLGCLTTRVLAASRGDLLVSV
ncbi:universal stress protein [Pseudoduganella sp. HUAS MS19]